MSELKLNVRYFQDSTSEGVPCREENFIRREVDMVLLLAQTAFVLVDMWNVHFIESWLERERKVIEEAILPALGAAREAGLTIIHAPCPEVASQYPQTERYPGGVNPSVSKKGPNWPPEDFVKRTGDFAAYAGPRDQPPK